MKKITTFYCKIETFAEFPLFVSYVVFLFFFLFCQLFVVRGRCWSATWSPPVHVQQLPTIKTSWREVFLGKHRGSIAALGAVSRPSCAANQTVVVTHFPVSSVTLTVQETLIHFQCIPFLPSLLLCHHCRLTCSILLEVGRLPLNISLWHDNTWNMPRDMIYTGHRRHLHISVDECYRRRLWSASWHTNVTSWEE